MSERKGAAQEPAARGAGNGPVLSRRAFLAGSAGAAFGLCGVGALAAPEARTRYLLSGGFDVEAGAFRIAVLDLIEGTRVDIPVEHQGHGLCLHPDEPGRAILFAQRPGTVSYEFDYRNGRLTNEFRSGPGRHFYGHGLAVAGLGILCTENRYQDGSGVVAVRNPATYAIEGEFPSYGTGPHELHLLAGGEILAVANGGLAADTDRGPLDKRVPGTLSLIDVASGELVEQIAFAGMSVKHLHATEAGTLALALRGSADALVMVRHGDGRLVRAQDPGGLFWEMRHHTLSIRACDRTGIVACSSSEGGLVAFWDMQTGALRHVERLRGACGVAMSHDQRHFFVTTRGEGRLMGLTNATARAVPGDGEVLLLDTGTLRPVAHEFPEGPRTLWLSHALGVRDPLA